MTVYDKTDEEHWSDNVQDWEAEFEHNDIVISMDPQERLGEETYVASRIRFNDPEHVEHLGLFWTKREANRYAETFDDAGYDTVLKFMVPTGPDLRAMRARLDITQVELAEAVGTTQATISGYENRDSQMYSDTLYDIVQELRKKARSQSD